MLNRLPLVLVLAFLVTAPNTNADPPFSRVYWPNGPESRHQVGSPAADGSGWATTALPDGTYPFLTYGPYATDLPTGLLRATFSLLVDNNTADQNVVATIDIARNAQSILHYDIRRTRFWAANTPQDFTMEFNNPGGGALEFRVRYGCCTYMEHLKTTVTLGASDPLDKIMTGITTPQFLMYLPYNPSDPKTPPQSLNFAGYGEQFVVQNGVWYMFYRVDTTPSVACKLSNITRGQEQWVRSSSDKGLTWSDPVAIAKLIPNSNAECSIPDGSPFFDAGTHTWHYLSQCIGPNLSWGLCHFSHQGDSPLHEFDIGQIPSVSSGQLAVPICSGPGKHCNGSNPAIVGSEGVPQILGKFGDDFFVSFSAGDAVAGTGFRAIAKTKDWINWRVSTPELPSDSVFSSGSCNGWEPGCVGGGAGASIASGDFNYNIVEAPTVRFNCTPGQHWPFALVRAPIQTTLDGILHPFIWPSSGSWEEFAGNPFVREKSTDVGCGLQYPAVFRDGSQIYFAYWNVSKSQKTLSLFTIPQ